MNMRLFFPASLLRKPLTPYLTGASCYLYQFFNVRFSRYSGLFLRVMLCLIAYVYTIKLALSFWVPRHC